MFLTTLPASARATALGDLAASMQPGSWAELPTIGLTDFLLAPGGSGDNITQYADNACWDPIRKEFHFQGASHSNPVQEYIRYSESANAWDSLPAAFQLNPGQIEHAYDHNAIDSATGDTYYRRYNSNIVLKRRAGDGQYSNIDLPAGSYQIASGLEWFPELNGGAGGLIFMDAYAGVLSWNPATAAWAPLRAAAQIAGIGAYQSAIRYNPALKIVVFGGGQGSLKLWQVDRNGVVSAKPDSPISIGTGEDGDAHFSVDPVSGKYIVTEKSGAMREYDAQTDSWRTLSAVFPGGDPTVGTIQTPIPDHGVIMYVKYNLSNSKVYLYKHAAGVAPPAKPSGLTLR